MNLPFRLAVIGLSAALITTPASPAAAQAAAAAAPQDWVVTRLREGNTLIASAPFDNGITIAARCSRDAFTLILTGLPEVDRSETDRTLILVVGEEGGERSDTWTVANDRTVAFSRVPAIITRRLIEGGPFQVIVPGVPGGPRTRYVMSLRPSESALQEVLTHCGRPVDSPRDEALRGDGRALPTGFTWTRMPLPEFPSATVSGAATAGSVTLTCRVGEGGRLSECIVEDEFPAGFNFGKAALRSLGAARVGQSEEARVAGAPFEGGFILFVMRFAMASN